MIASESEVAMTMARRLAEALRDEPAAKRLWVWWGPGFVTPEHDYVELCLVTGPLDAAAKRRISEAAVRVTDEFSEADKTLFHVTGAEGELLTPPFEVRDGAIEVPLHPR